MIVFKYLILSFIFSYNKPSIELEIKKEMSIITQNKTDGIDPHLNENEVENAIMLSKIKRNQYLFYYLQLLENQKLTMFEKIQWIEKNEFNSISGPNIQNGGLWKDWE